MALPKHIHELLMTTQPEMVKLETDDLLQLIAFLKHPQDASFDVNRMWAEEDRGILTYRREIDQRDEFQKHCQRVRDYNILRREAVAALPSVPKPKMLVVRSWAELGIGIADTDPIAFIPAPGLGERVKKTSGHPLALPGNR